MRLAEYSRRGTTRDRFVPSTVYQQTNGHSHAIEGILLKKYPDDSPRFEWSGAPERPCYLIIPTKPGRPQQTIARERANRKVPSEDLWTKHALSAGIFWVPQLQRAWPELAADAKLAKELPPDYRKLADLNFDRKDYNVALPHTAHHPRGGWIMLAPLTVVVDIATSPFQLIGYSMMRM